MPKQDQLILVTGATGKQGRAVVRQLREHGFPVRALTRDPGNEAARVLAGRDAEVVRGDLEDRASLTKALEGVYGVFGVLTPLEAGPEGEVRQGKNLADAAQHSGVRHFVYSSVAGADQKTGIPHFESKARIEEHILGLGIPWSFIRPVFFMENLLRLAPSLRHGGFSVPLSPERTLQMIAVHDIGAFAAMAFEHPDRWKSRAVDLAGDEISMTALAQVFSRVLIRQIRYEQTPLDELERQAGRDMALMWRWYENVGNRADIASLRREYPPLLTVERWVQAQDWEVARRAG